MPASCCPEDKFTAHPVDFHHTIATSEGNFRLGAALPALLELAIPCAAWSHQEKVDAAGATTDGPPKRRQL